MNGWTRRTCAALTATLLLAPLATLEAADHPRAFQTQGAEGDVRVAGGSRDEEVAAFREFRGQAAIRNLVGKTHSPHRIIATSARKL
jgi:hypothetical protein